MVDEDEHGRILVTGANPASGTTVAAKIATRLQKK